MNLAFCNVLRMFIIVKGNYRNASSRNINPIIHTVMLALHT